MRLDTCSAYSHAARAAAAGAARGCFQPIAGASMQRGGPPRPCTSAAITTLRQRGQESDAACCREEGTHGNRSPRRDGTQQSPRGGCRWLVSAGGKRDRRGNAGRWRDARRQGWRGPTPPKNPPPGSLFKTVAFSACRWTLQGSPNTARAAVRCPPNIRMMRGIRRTGGGGGAAPGAGPYRNSLAAAARWHGDGAGPRDAAGCRWCTCRRRIFWC